MVVGHSFAATISSDCRCRSNRHLDTTAARKRHASGQDGGLVSRNASVASQRITQWLLMLLASFRLAHVDSAALAFLVLLFLLRSYRPAYDERS
jgi:hypothetical protein